MTAQEILSNLSGSLMDDERILSARERELLASLLQHITTHSGSRDNAVSETIARAVGEVIAQRAYGILGNNIAQRLLDPTAGFDPYPLRAHSPHPPSPSPPGPGALPTGPRPADIPAGPRPAGPRPAPGVQAEPNGILGNNIAQRLLDPTTGSDPYPLRAHSPHPPSPSPPGPGALPTGPRPADIPAGPRPAGPRPAPGIQAGPRGGPRDIERGPRPEEAPGPRGPTLPEANPGPRGFSVPQAVNLGPRATAVQSEAGVAVLEAPATLPAHCVVLDEFLAPAELEALMAYTMAKEAEFQLSEVISPDIGGGVDFEYRRSRVLQDLGPHRELVADRVQSFLPRILEQLNREPFAVSRVEAQITASNDGDFFRWHNDNGQGEIATREITFVYFFHREPKQFQGGELRLYDSRWENGMYRPQETYRTIVPQQNQAILFLSSLAHEISPVECSSGAFADSRFTLNGWLHQ